MAGKLRPVGSRVPRLTSQPVVLPWEGVYTAEYCGSGTDALALAVGLAMLDRPDVTRPEVIIPAYGCPDLVTAILCQGARPVLVDLKPDTPFMDLHCLVSAITEQTVAVVGVGLLGIPERLESLAGICRKRNLRLIEDSAQCFPPRSVEQVLADFVVLSFGRGKPINLMGGGALLCREPLTSRQRRFLDQVPDRAIHTGFAWQVKRLVFNLLMTRPAYALLEKLPFLGLGKTRFHPHDHATRLTFPLALLHGGLREFDERPLIHSEYEQALSSLEKRGWVLLSTERFSAIGVQPDRPRLRFGVLAPDAGRRKEALKALNDAGIGANGLYEVTLPEIKGMSVLGRSGEYSVAADFASRLVTLPSHEDVTSVDVQRIASILVLFGPR
ncbi:DegT/DnrJ/EryC1/StrS family aminotransferase [Marinobacter sp.]|uniref:DegT/DnrJ/EryC1/StrS family aminotransferase n=1 Tax=Marinobacter sp. TaxID=50741 RepID=UPI0034A110BF